MSARQTREVDKSDVFDQELGVARKAMLERIVENPNAIARTEL